MRVFLIKIVLQGFALLPLRWTHILGFLLGQVFYFFPTTLKHVSKTNIRLCFPQLDELEQKKRLRLSLTEAAKAMVETGPMWFWDRQRILGSIKQVSGIELIRAGQAAGKGIILAAPHVGCWEIIGRYYLEHGPLTVLYRPPRVKEMEPLMIQSRQRDGAQIVPTTPKGVKSLYQELKRNHCVGILPDQDPGKGGAGVFVDFFRVQANTMTLLPRLAHKSGATVLFAFAERLPRGQGYHLHFQAADPALSGPDLKTGALELNRGVESCITKIPEQYQWGYKRFKTRPKGERKVY